MLGDSPLSPERLTSRCSECVCSDIPTQRLDVLTVPAVVPGNDRRSRRSIPVDKDTGFTHAGDTNGGDAAPTGGSLQRRPESFDCSIEYFLGVELHAV